VETRYAFVRDVIELLTGVPSFRIEEKLGRKKNYRDWPRILRWWLAKNTLDKQPAAKDVTAWFEFVSKNFVYRASWGVGSILGLVLDGEGEQSPIKALEISDWPRSGLPWIAFWLKELLAWGTLDPVAAYLLARGGAVDRPGAEQEARRYYEQADTADEPNALLDPRTIRAWLDARTPEVTVVRETRTLRVDAVLSNAATDYARNRLTVAPLETEEGFIWIDPAGYVVARSARRADWPTPISDFVFELSVTDSSIHGMTYQEHL
jgi:hypothetical protein